jgi:hypothetical protein
MAAISTDVSRTAMEWLRVLRLAGCSDSCVLDLEGFDVARLAHIVRHSTKRQSAVVYVSNLSARNVAFPGSDDEARLIAWIKAQHAAEDAYYQEATG